MKCIAYARCSTKDVDPAKIKGRLVDFITETLGDDLKQWNIYIDVTEGYDYSDRDWFSRLRVEIATGQVDKVLVSNVYDLDNSHSKILDFLSTCQRMKVRLYSVNEEWLNEATPQVVETFVNTLHLVARKLRRHRSQRVSEGKKKNKVGHPAIPDVTRRRLCEMWEEGWNVKQIQKRFTYRKHGKEKRLALSTIYRIISRYKKTGDYRIKLKEVVSTNGE